MILLFYSFLINNHSVPFLFQTPTPDQEGPTCSNLTFLESVSSKELAYYISQYDYELFNAVNVVSTSSCLVNFSYFQKKKRADKMRKNSPMHMLDRDSFGMYFILKLSPLQSDLQHEFVYNIFGKENYNQITANLDLLLKRFNEVRHFRCSSHEYVDAKRSYDSFGLCS